MWHIYLKSLKKKTFAYDEDEKEPDYTVHKSIRNSVYAYPEKELLLPEFHIFKMGAS